MEATGSEHPIVYILGGSPEKSEDEQGKQFVGKSGQVLRFRIPKDWIPDIRFNNAVNCRPPDNRTPTDIELTACSPRIDRDIEKTKPKAIFGFGAIPLSRMLQQSSIGIWRGRRVPIQVGEHSCWYYPMLHPSYLLHKRKFTPRSLDEYGCDEEFAFALDIKKALSEVENLSQPIIHSPEQAQADIEIVNDVGRAVELVKEISNDISVGVDIETDRLRPYNKGAKILSIGFSGKSHTFSFALDHSQASWSDKERKKLDEVIESFLYDSQCRKIAHHLPFEMEWFAFFYGKSCLYEGRWEDSESQAYILDVRRGGLSLDFLCLQYFGLNLKAISSLDRKNLDKTPLQQVLKYNAIDARYHRLLYLAQAKRIKEEKLTEVYEHQLRRIPSLVLAQMQGVPIDLNVVHKLKDKYEKKAKTIAAAIADEEIVKQFNEEKGREFNPSSSHDVNFLINDLLKVDTESSDKEQLSHVKHPIAKQIVQWREVNKNLSTYVLSVSEQSDNLYDDGMLHPIMGTTRVSTARSSSDGPNIQNFPKRDEGLKEVRAQIRSSDPNIKVVSFDWAGIQARNVAMESRDKVLVDAFWHNYDIHSDWRERIVKQYPKWISKSDLRDKDRMKHYRYLAKNKLVFPAFFGSQAYGISVGLGIPEKDCKDLLDEFYDIFSGVKAWQDSVRKMYYEEGYVTGLSGYRRPAPISANETINSPIQADEATIVLDAMARMSELEDDRYQASFEVHDDISFFWPKNEIEKRAEVIVKIILDVPFEWAKIVPMEVEMSVGEDWLSMKEVGKFSSDKWNGIVEIKNDHT